VKNNPAPGIEGDAAFGGTVIRLALLIFLAFLALSEPYSRNYPQKYPPALMTSKTTDRQIRPNASRLPRIGLQQRRKEHGNDCMCDGACASA
jgi:hypothetical protein